MGDTHRYTHQIFGVGIYSMMLAILSKYTVPSLAHSQTERERERLGLGERERERERGRERESVNLCASEVLATLKLQSDGVMRRKAHWVDDGHRSPQLVQGVVDDVITHTHPRIHLGLQPLHHSDVINRENQ